MKFNMRRCFASTQDQLEIIAEEHSRWLYTSCNEGKQADFSDCILNNLDFSYMNFKDAIFNGADIRECNFDDSILTGADFKNARIKKCSFVESVLLYAKFESALICESLFIRANLNGVLLKRENLYNNDFSDAKVNISKKSKERTKK